MENFFNYISKPLKQEDVELWLRANNVIIEKVDLFSDFCNTLDILINETYLGDYDSNSETRIKLTDVENKQHFKWCWVKTIDIFKKEDIVFSIDGEHYDYFYSFFSEIFYSNNELNLKKSIRNFYKDLFDLDKQFTKSDLDMLTNMYKLLDNNIEK